MATASDAGWSGTQRLLALGLLFLVGLLLLLLGPILRGRVPFTVGSRPGAV